MRREIRVLGFDDGPFDKFRDRSAILVGTYFRGGRFLDGILSTKIRVDGANATQRIAKLINDSKFTHDIKAIMLGGITVAGCNIIDIKRLNKLTGMPIIVFMRKRPDSKKFRQTLLNLGMEKKLIAVNHAGPLHRYSGHFFQCHGLEPEDAKAILTLTTTNAEIPEPLRIAHIIAAGIIRGESYGNA